MRTLNTLCTINVADLKPECCHEIAESELLKCTLAIAFEKGFYWKSFVFCCRYILNAPNNVSRLNVLMCCIVSCCELWSYVTLLVISCHLQLAVSASHLFLHCASNFTNIDSWKRYLILSRKQFGCYRQKLVFWRNLLLFFFAVRQSFRLTCMCNNCRFLWQTTTLSCISCCSSAWFGGVTA